MDIYSRRAELYDVAFSWDISGEVDWLLERMGAGVSRVLEPGCGSGRMFLELARRGIEVVGVDLSAEMLARASRRMLEAGYPEPVTILADMSSFDIEQICDAAMCPINTFGYLLTHESALSHLECVARCLRGGARYLVQVDLADLEHYSPRAVDDTSRWEMDADGMRVRATVTPAELDRATGVCMVHYRFEILDAAEAKTVVDEHHRMRVWDWRGWSSLISESPFTQIAAYDGNHPERPALPLDAGLDHARLTWHELELRPAGDA